MEKYQTSSSITQEPNSNLNLNQENEDSSFSSKFKLKKRKRFPVKYLVGIVFLVLTVVGAGVGLALTQINQDVRQQASGFADDPYSCVDGSPCLAGYQCDRSIDRCVPTDSVDPSSSIASTRPCSSFIGLFDSSVAGSEACIQDGVRKFECLAGLVNKDGGCVRREYTDSCRSSTGLFSSSVANSHSCTLENVTMYECDLGYKNQDGGCASTLSQCGSSIGLFGDSVSNSHPCALNGATWYECNSNYKNKDGGCEFDPSVGGVPPAPACSSPSGLFSGAVSNSHTCNLNGSTYYECNYGFENRDGGCTQTGLTMVWCFSVTDCMNSVQREGSCNPGEYTNYTDCRLNAEAAAVKKMCWSTSSNCVLGVEKQACDVGEYESHQACLDSIATKMCWSTSSNCVLGVEKQTCGVGEYDSHSSCLSSIPKVCWSASSNCSVGTTKPSCSSGEYEDVTACYDTLPPQEVCWSPANNCILGIYKDSCSAGEYTDTATCMSNLILEEGSSGTGSLEGGSVSGS